MKGDGHYFLNEYLFQQWPGTLVSKVLKIEIGNKLILLKPQ